MRRPTICALAIADPRLVGIIGLSSSSRAKAVIDNLGGDLRTAGIPFVSDISLDALFSAQPSIYSMATTVGNEVAVVKRLLKDRGSVRPMFVGLAGDDYSEALGDGLAGPPDAVTFISSQRLPLAGNALDKAAVAALVQSIRQSPPDLLLLAIQSGPAAQLVKALLTAKVDVPVFVLYGRAKRILDLVGSPPPASEMLELGRDGVPNVANERLRQMIWQGRGRDWVFDDLPNKDATGWKEGSCTLTTSAAPLKLMDDRNRRAIGRGAQYADLVALFGARGRRCQRRGPGRRGSRRPARQAVGAVERGRDATRSVAGLVVLGATGQQRQPHHPAPAARRRAAAAGADAVPARRP